MVWCTSVKEQQTQADGIKILAELIIFLVSHSTRLPATIAIVNSEGHSSTMAGNNKGETLRGPLVLEKEYGKGRIGVQYG